MGCPAPALPSVASRLIAAHFSLPSSPSHSHSHTAQADIIVCTPEKWDAVTRRVGGDSAGLVGQIALLCVDEVSKGCAWCGGGDWVLGGRV